MKIDIIIPTYNRAELTKRAILSVLGQTYKDYEIYIIDDGSTDQTQEMLKAFPSVHKLKQTNQGVSAARNYGIKNSQSHWIAFLDSDDEWLPEKLQTQMDYILKHSQFRFVHTEEIWIRNGVRVNPKLKHKKSQDSIFERSLDFCIISPSTSMIRRDLFNQHGGFSPEYPVCEDYDLWLKILAREEVGFVEMPLTKKYGGHKDQLSTQYIAMNYWRLKSLVNLIQQKDLSSDKKLLIENELRKKADILIKGYEKHENSEKVLEIKEMLKLI